MGEVSEAAKAKADQLVAEEWGYCAPGTVAVDALHYAFARFVQKVSDAAKEASDQFAKHPASAPCIKARATLAPFILAEPLDPLVDALAGCALFAEDTDWDEAAELFRNTLAERGLCIAEAPTPSPISTIDSNSNQGAGARNRPGVD